MKKQTPWWRAQFTRDTWSRALYVVLSAVLGVLYFTFVLLGLALALYALLVVVGAFVLAGTFALARAIARWERARAGAMLGLTIVAPTYRQPQRPGLLRRFGARLRDPQTWKDISYALLSLPIGAVCFMLVAALGQMIFRAVTYPFIALAENTYATDWGGPTYVGAVALHSGQGLFALFLLPLIVRGLTRLQTATVGWLLAAGPTGQLDRPHATGHDGADGNLGASSVSRPVAR
ncbi:sensor domain-containing protein [Plantactinospora endophytica]|uniref:sensor domain-containing protein n=1 Tax=Plantactinospora endophytica TaxID=673535 RepID=UPI0019418726|nr:sensor domain-containing protein [Plantactinospora endophytica]